MIRDEDRPNEDWPDKELLETALGSWFKDPDINVKEFRSRIATNEGDNYTSDMYRVTVMCERRKEPITVIIKRLIGDKVISETTAFTREEQILRDILPEMYAALRKVMPDVEPFGAGFIYATYGVLMMEDLKQAGFQMANRQFGLDLNHCSLVIRNLARYHAAGVFLMERQYIDISLFRKSIQAEQRHVMDRYCSLLSHGDVWVNNLLFRYSSSGKPDGVRFVDFQLSSITNPSIDLQLFLNSSTNDRVRTTCMDHLIKEFHETLCRTMSNLGCSMRPPTIEKLRKDYDQRSHFGMFVALAFLPAILAEPGQFDFTDMVTKGHPQIEIFTKKSLRKAMEWFLPLFESKGFL